MVKAMEGMKNEVRDTAAQLVEEHQLYGIFFCDKPNGLVFLNLMGHKATVKPSVNNFVATITDLRTGEHFVIHEGVIKADYRLVLLWTLYALELLNRQEIPVGRAVELAKEKFRQ